MLDDIAEYRSTRISMMTKVYFKQGNRVFHSQVNICFERFEALEKNTKTISNFSFYIPGHQRYISTKDDTQDQYARSKMINHLYESAFRMRELMAKIIHWAILIVII